MPPIFASLGAGSARSYGLINRGSFKFFSPLPVVNSSADIQYLIVAGGGGGAGGAGGGGGGGGLRIGTTPTTVGNTYNVAVGGGGSRGASDGANGSRGGVSYYGPNGLTTITSDGGGGAVHDNRTAPSNGNGGSGAGGGYNNNGSYGGTSPGGIATPGQGNNGGTGRSPSGNYCGAGGGGAGGGGNDSGPNFGGAGGAALFSSLNGTSTAYSGGASGSINTGLPSNPLLGGSSGATGGNSAQYSSGTAGFNNQGGGGAGGSNTNGGSNGGSGVVILRIPSASNTTLGRAIVTGSPTFVSVGGERTYRYTGSGTIRFIPTTAAIANVTIYSVYNGGNRAAEYSVLWSDDGVNWTTSFTGVMTSTNCGIMYGSILTSDSRLQKRYWRYNIGNPTIAHHPRVSRIDFIDTLGFVWRAATFASDNCSDIGTYWAGATANVGYIDLGTTGFTP